MTLNEILGRLSGVRRAGAGYLAQCPAHEDDRQSLSVGEGHSGVVLKCHAGCESTAVVDALGLTMRDLFDGGQPRPPHAPSQPQAQPLTESQVDAWQQALRNDPETWETLTQKMRFPESAIVDARLGLASEGGRRWLVYPYFRNGKPTYAKLRALDGKKSFMRRPSGMPSQLYGVDSLQPGGTVLVTEGERDAVAARAIGLHAELAGCAIVSLPDGADSAKSPAIVDALRSQSTIILATDADAPGDAAAAALAKALGASRCSRMRLPHHKDLGDLIASLEPAEALREALATIGPVSLERGETASIQQPKEPPLTKSYASACRVLRDPEVRALVLGEGDLEFNQMDLLPTIAREPITDEVLSRLRERCELVLRGSKRGEAIKFSAADLRDAVSQVARERPFHPVQEYLQSQQWDGTPRIEMLPTVIGAADSALNAAMLKKFMISAVARALSPGCKVDAALVLVGAQGIGKSRFLQVLAHPWFSDTPMTIGDKDALLAVHASWIHEWAELESTQRAARAETVKAFLSSSEDVFRAPYDRAPKRHQRACVFAGSTNSEQFLADPTGARRFWILPIVGRVDVDAVVADKDQLWAEAVHLFRQGVPWHLTGDEEESLRRAQRRHELQDPWEAAILSLAEAQGEVTTEGVLVHLDVKPAQQTRAMAMRIGAVLARAGYNRRRARLSTGGRAYVYRRDHGSTAQIVRLEGVGT